MTNQSLEVNYSVVNDWGSGSQSQINITNNGSSDIDNWNLDFDWSSDITKIWGAEVVSNNSGNYTIEPASWNREIQPGETINVGFLSNGSDLTAQNLDIEVLSPNNPGNPGNPPNNPNNPPNNPGNPDIDIFNPAPRLSLGQNYQGRATFYDPSGVKGNSGYDVISGSAVEGLTAINRFQWNGSEASGAFLQVSGPKQRAGAEPIVVQVFDQLPDRADGLDLSQEGFAKIADPVDGIVDIDYELIGPGDNFRTPYGYTIGQGIVAQGIEGTNPFYAAVRLNNHRYPVESVELIEEDGDQVALRRESDNRFVVGSGYPLNEPQDLLVTDIFGQEVTLEDINITGGPNTISVTGEQFDPI